MGICFRGSGRVVRGFFVLFSVVLSASAPVGAGEGRAVWLFVSCLVFCVLCDLSNDWRARRLRVDWAGTASSTRRRVAREGTKTVVFCAHCSVCAVLPCHPLP